MSIFSTQLEKLIAETNKTQNAICKDLGISKQKLSKWKTTYNEPSLDELAMVASYFNVTVDYLLGLTDEWGNAQLSSGSSLAGTTKSPSDLSEDEQELLDIYVSLTPERRRDVLTLVKSLATADAWQNKKHA